MKNLPELRIMIIGPREAGRTLLAQRLSGQVKRNDVIEIHECEASYDKDTYSLQIWDFSGKEIHHATHQLFFTPQSMYILVDDTRVSENQAQNEYFQYWFEAVKRYGQESPMIIVQNEKGGRSKEVAVIEMKERYPFFKEIYPLDLYNCTDHEIAQLRHDIIRLGQPIVQTFDTFNLNAFRNAIKSQVDSSIMHMEVQSFKSLCNNHCGSEQYNVDITLSQLHNLGIIFNFKQFEALKEWVILDRNWLVTSIYKILDSSTVERQDGKFSLIDVSQILDIPEYKDRHRQVIQLMEKFYLCYAVEESTWMAPQLFKAKPVKMGEWSHKAYIKEYYAKFVFLPKGLVEQLLVRSYKDINLFEPWLGGFCFDKYDTRLIVLEQWTEKTIALRFTHGDQIPHLACFIVQMLKEVSQIHRVGFELQVPCTCSICSRSKSPVLYRYEEDLLERKRKNRKEIECNRSYEKVAVDAVLEQNIAEQFPQTTEPGIKSFPRMNNTLKATLIILVILIGLYWFFTNTKTGSKISLEWFGTKLEAENGGPVVPDKTQTEAAILETCNVQGRIKIGSKWVTKNEVSLVKFANEFTRTSSISEGGIYRFENYPKPPNKRAILEVYVIGVSEPLSISIDVNTHDGNELTYHDAIFDGSYEKRTGKLNSVTYNGQVINIKGNGNSVNQSSQNGNNNSSQQKMYQHDTLKK